MLLILELGMFFGGLYSLIKGEIPSFLIGGSKFRVAGIPARILGAVMIVPLPLVFFIGFVMGMLEAERGIILIAEIVIVLGTAIAVYIATLFVREPVETPVIETDGVEVPLSEDVSKIQQDINRKVDGSTIYLILGALGPVSFVVCPLVFFRMNKAIRLIEEHNVAQNKLTHAKVVRVISAVLFAGWVLFLGILFSAFVFAT